MHDGNAPHLDDCLRDQQDEEQQQQHGEEPRGQHHVEQHTCGYGGPQHSSNGCAGVGVV